MGTLKKLGVLASEMEASHLFVLVRERGVLESHRSEACFLSIFLLVVLKF
jgi:uridine phosphorylase